MATAGDPSTRLDLSPDELLSTTRSVRRLDLTRHVDPTLIERCEVFRSGPRKVLDTIVHWDRW